MTDPQTPDPSAGPASDLPTDPTANAAPGVKAKTARRSAKALAKDAAAPEDAPLPHSAQPEDMPEAQDPQAPGDATLDDVAQAADGASDPAATLESGESPEPADAPPIPPPPSEPPSHAPAAEGARSGAGTMILGGALAAALGFGAALLAFPQGFGQSERAQVLAEITSRLARLEAAQTALLIEAETRASSAASAAAEAATNLLAERLDAGLAGLEQKLAAPPEGAVGASDAALAGIEARLATLEQTAPVAPPALDATEVEALLARLSTATATAEAEAARLQAERDAWATERAALEAERQAIADQQTAEAQRAADIARSARITAARLDLEIALADGGALADPLARLAAEGLTPGADLTTRADSGVATQAQLQARFPEAARAALRASLAVDPEAGLTERALTFLRVQTGARALAPRTGDDPDAVLSRAEAALANADLANALSELEALPPAAAAEMAAWRDAAVARLATLQAFAALPAAPAP